jgi:hypothetical protein
MRWICIALICALVGPSRHSKLDGSAYDDLILADHPIAFWNDASGSDRTNHHHARLINGPAAATMPNGDNALTYNGVNQYMEVSNEPELSVSSSHVLTIEAWLRPDVLDFVRTEGSGYVYWLGKGEQDQQEYAARMYGLRPTGHDSNRPNRISGYVFNGSGGLGAGSYYQAPVNNPVRPGEWMFYVLIINTSKETFSTNNPTGYTKLFLIRKAGNGALDINRDQDALVKYNIIPVAGNAPFRVGTRNFGSYFDGAVGKVAIYNYELTDENVVKHAHAMFGKQR